jgi:hypothetical protein
MTGVELAPVHSAQAENTQYTGINPNGLRNVSEKNTHGADRHPITSELPTPRTSRL